MTQDVLIVPGYLGSGPGHWQSWAEATLPSARQVRGIDWQAPVLADWAQRVRRAIDKARHPVWILAHSFGCLASAVAVADRAEQVGGVLFVAPANPDRFSAFGLAGASGRDSIAGLLPRCLLGCQSMVVASTNDPWMAFDDAAVWADRWGSHLVNLGPAGHINIDSGFGPWPRGLELLSTMQRLHAPFPLGDLGDRPIRRGRRGALTQARRQTRAHLGY